MCCGRRSQSDNFTIHTPHHQTRLHSLVFKPNRHLHQFPGGKKATGLKSLTGLVCRWRQLVVVEVEWRDDISSCSESDPSVGTSIKCTVSQRCGTHRQPPADIVFHCPAQRTEERSVAEALRSAVQCGVERVEWPPLACWPSLSHQVTQHIFTCSTSQALYCSALLDSKYSENFRCQNTAIFRSTTRTYAHE